MERVTARRVGAGRGGAGTSMGRGGGRAGAGAGRAKVAASGEGPHASPEAHAGAASSGNGARAGVGGPEGGGGDSEGGGGLQEAPAGSLVPPTRKEVHREARVSIAAHAGCVEQLEEHIDRAQVQMDQDSTYKQMDSETVGLIRGTRHEGQGLEQGTTSFVGAGKKIESSIQDSTQAPGLVNSCSEGQDEERGRTRVGTVYRRRSQSRDRSPVDFIPLSCSEGDGSVRAVVRSLNAKFTTPSFSSIQKAREDWPPLVPIENKPTEEMEDVQMGMDDSSRGANMHSSDSL
eukprot:Gb_24943 [translate_table: standard]